MTKTSGEERKEARAIARFIRMAPRKLRLVMEEIRGKAVHDAINILRFTPKRAARTIEKVLKSALANAENNFRMSGDDLFVAAGFVDGGPTMKRYLPRAMGRASRVHKRLSHITIVVREREEASR
jgi:large subunit ribosomal protein L22